MLTSGADDVVFLFDVDNTLLDNDRFSAALDARLTQALGAEGRERYRTSYETLRDERGYADYLEPLQRIRPPFVADSALLQLSTFLLDFPFAGLVYPGALDTLAAMARIGTTVILSDGDLVFQPRKIQRSGLWGAVEGRVLLTVHKQRTLDAVQKAYPARHYVMVDDKPMLLSDTKAALGDRVTTVFVRQGHYAAAGIERGALPPDVAIATIAQLVDTDLLPALRTATQELP